MRLWRRSPIGLSGPTGELKLLLPAIAHRLITPRRTATPPQSESEL
jgi:hypothetical protein